MKQQKIGLIILVVSIFALALLLFSKLQTDKQMLNACEQSCGESGGTSCSLDSCPYHQGNNLSWVLVTISALVAFLGGTGLYLSLPQKKETIVTEKEYDVSSLSDEEKKVFFFIKDHKDGIYQSSITKEFSLSKVQVTRLLDKLESQDLIERKRRGLTNMVIVK